METPGPYRLGQRIAFHGKLLGYLRDFQSLIEPFLRLLQHLLGQHHRPPPVWLLIKTRYPFLSIALNRALDAD